METSKGDAKSARKRKRRAVHAIAKYNMVLVVKAKE
jgi:hypothetical protein